MGIEVSVLVVSIGTYHLILEGGSVLNLKDCTYVP